MTINKRRRTGGVSTSGDLIVGRCDTREYRFVTLKNGIEAILVRIPEGQSSKAAVSVSVNVGSMSEPDECGGLAHFVEHCVFLGNKKYPNRNSLDKLLSKHNGYSNAHTELEYTAFYLEVNREGLAKALNIFSAAFDAPLFDVELSCAELEAVDSEFHEIIMNDECRIEQILCHIAHPDHPYKKFTWGNRDSLLPPTRSKDELVSKAREFFHTHYTPNRMKLAIVSSFSLDKMEKLVTDEFSAVGIQNPASIPILSNPLFNPSVQAIADLPATIAIKPITDVHQLILMFPMPPIVDTYREKPADYLAHLIGHECEGSLIEVLRLANLATDISAGVGSDGYSSNSGLSLFEIKLTLTDQGISEWQKIVSKYIFPYIEKICIVESVFTEMKSIGEFQFNYTSEDASKDPIDIAEELSMSLLGTMRIDRSDILIYDQLYLKFDEKLIGKYFSFLKRENCLTMIVSQKFDFPSVDVQIEPRFGIEFALLTSGENIAVDDSFQVGSFVIPPNANPFVPSVDDLKTISMTTIKSTELSVVPTTVVDTSKVRIYHFTQTRSNPCPKIDVRVRLNFDSNIFPSCLDGFLAAEVWVGYVTDLLEAKLYTAKLIGYQVSLAAVTVGIGHESSVGIEIVVNGFYGKIMHVLDMLISSFEFDGGNNWDTQRMDRVIEQIERNFRNEEMHPATNQAVNIRRNTISANSFYRSIEKLGKLKNENVRNPTRVSPCSVDVMVVGDLPKGQSLVSQLESRLNGINFSEKFVPGERVEMVRRIQSELMISEPSMNPEEHTTVVILYYQFSGEFSVSSAAISEIVGDLMSEPFFDSLRTEEQLGYSVRSGARYTNGSVGFEFLIQSSNESADKLVLRIEKFIETFYDKEVGKMENDEYVDQLEALMETFEEPPASLAAEAKDFWSEITENRLMWDYNERVRDEIRAKFLKNKLLVKKVIQENFRKDNRVIVKVNGHVAKTASR